MWTDDLTVPLPPGRTVAELVDLVLQATLDGAGPDRIEQLLRERFGLSQDDAALARDRTGGGLVRAASGNPANRPDPAEDPVAFESYQRATADQTLITRIFPDHGTRQ